MLKLIKIFYQLLCEIFFDSKEQYDFRSEKFNGLRFGGVIVFLASILLNAYLFEQYWKLSDVRVQCERQLDHLLLNKNEEADTPSKTQSEQKKEDEEDSKLSSLAARIAEKKKASK
jgi:hypothetical protein